MLELYPSNPSSHNITSFILLRYHLNQLSWIWWCLNTTSKILSPPTLSTPSFSNNHDKILTPPIKMNRIQAIIISLENMMKVPHATPHHKIDYRDRKATIRRRVREWHHQLPWLLLLFYVHCHSKYIFSLLNLPPTYR